LPRAAGAGARLGGLRGGAVAARSTSARSPPLRTGAGERASIDAQLQRALARRRRNARALACGGSLRHCRLYRCGRCRYSRNGGDRDRHGRNGGGRKRRRKRRRRHARLGCAFGAYQRERRSDGKPFVTGLDQDFFQHAGDERLDVDVGLVGLDDGDDFAALDPFPRPLQPLHHLAGGHVGAQPGHEEFGHR
jgi:hypothetical protein